mmetsp:Transcript_8018/g.8858  ORF Transcript_8018/g.8858 Transcript_8018/m.8858 type:complete len:216 (-) Transcript_8018:560-1207(-)
MVCARFFVLTPINTRIVSAAYSAHRLFLLSPMRMTRGVIIPSSIIKCFNLTSLVAIFDKIFMDKSVDLTFLCSTNILITALMPPFSAKAIISLLSAIFFFACSNAFVKFAFLYCLNVDMRALVEVSFVMCILGIGDTSCSRELFACVTVFLRLMFCLVGLDRVGRPLRVLFLLDDLLCCRTFLSFKGFPPCVWRRFSFGSGERCSPKRFRICSVL